MKNKPVLREICASCGEELLKFDEAKQEWQRIPKSEHLATCPIVLMKNKVKEHFANSDMPEMLQELSPDIVRTVSKKKKTKVQSKEGLVDESLQD